MLLKRDVGSAKDVTLKDITKKLKTITKATHEFLNPAPTKVVKVEHFLKDVYNYTTKTSGTTQKSNEVLPEIYLEGLDVEAVWQQIDIKNNIELPIILEDVSSALAIPNASLNFKIKSPNEESDECAESDENNDEYDMSDEAEDEGIEEMGSDDEIEKKKLSKTKLKKKKGKASIVDDKFFKLSELDAFLKQEDKKEMMKGSKNMNKSGEDDYIDYFDDELGIGDNVSDDEANLNYKEFFDDGSDHEEDDEDQENRDEDFEENEKVGKDYFEEENQSEEEEQLDEDEELDENGELEDDEPLDEDEQTDEDDSDQEEVKKVGKNKKGQRAGSDDDNKETEDDKPKSSFEIQQQKLKARIADLEEEALAEKPWQLKGEVKASHRPENALLEEFLEYDVGSRPAPVITHETNLRLEDVIKQRIKDKAWDDPVRKVKPVNLPQDFRKKLVLDGEKSKESLAQIYEKEYQKQIENFKHGEDGVDNEEEPKQHKEIKSMMTELFKKLDALSNFHFTPKPAKVEPKIITNIPAVHIEEVAPVAVSNAQLLAPEEIKTKSKGDILGKTERTKTDKNRERRHKKEHQKRQFKRKEERELEKMKAGIPLTKKEDKEKALKSVIKQRNVTKMSESTNTTLKSSKLFFNQLQGNTAAGEKVKRKTNKFGDSEQSAKKFKL